jgi:uncharacterized protein (UPF0276 family)
MAASSEALASASQVGIGLRQPHYTDWFAAAPALGFVEVHSENFFADGGAALAVLQRVRERHAVSLHGVGLALGSAAGVDAWHLDRLARLVERIAPVRVSDHASFARAPLAGRVVHGNDLLPIAFTAGALDILVDNVSRVQDRLRRTLLVENLSAYLSFEDDALAEPEFFARLCRRAGCGMLLDLNNLMVNAVNAGAADPLATCRACVDALPADVVGEIHLAGYVQTDDLAIDDHGSRVRPQVWHLYQHTLQRLGPRPTLIEWDTDVPPLAVLLGEAATAAACLAGAVPEALAT